MDRLLTGMLPTQATTKWDGAGGGLGGADLPELRCAQPEQASRTKNLRSPEKRSRLCVGRPKAEDRLWPVHDQSVHRLLVRFKAINGY